MKEEKQVNQVNLHTGRLPVVVIQIYVCSDPSQSLNYSGNNQNKDERRLGSPSLCFGPTSCRVTKVFLKIMSKKNDHNDEFIHNWSHDIDKDTKVQ